MFDGIFGQSYISELIQILIIYLFFNESVTSNAKQTTRVMQSLLSGGVTWTGLPLKKLGAKIMSNGLGWVLEFHIFQSFQLLVIICDYDRKFLYGHEKFSSGDLDVLGSLCYFHSWCANTSWTSGSLIGLFEKSKSPLVFNVYVNQISLSMAFWLHVLGTRKYICWCNVPAGYWNEVDLSVA